MYIIHESGIKIFRDFIHPDSMDDQFFKDNSLSEDDVFIVAGCAYRIVDSFGDGDCFAKEIRGYKLDEWVLSGNTHPKVKWHGSYATYDGDCTNPSLLSFRGVTYFYNPYNGEIIDSVVSEVCCEYAANTPG